MNITPITEAENSKKFGLILTNEEVEIIRELIYEKEENVRLATRWWYEHGYSYLICETTADKSVYRVRKGNREITYSVPHGPNFSIDTFTFCFLETWHRKKGA